MGTVITGVPGYQKHRVVDTLHGAVTPVGEVQDSLVSSGDEANKASNN